VSFLLKNFFNLKNFGANFSSIISLKNYIIATFIGSMPSMFVTVALGSGIENIIDKNEKLSILNVIGSQEIYLPIIGFFVILIIAFVIKKNYFKS